MITRRSLGATITFLILLVGLQAPARGGEHYARTLGILTAEQGREAPDFALRDSAGKVHRLRDYREKIVLLGFGATW